MTSTPLDEALLYTYNDSEDDPIEPRKDNWLMGVTNGLAASYDYDGAGNTIFEQTNGTTRAFEYNHHLRLKKVTENETILGEYTYDALGRRVKKVAGEITTIYIYDQRGFLIEGSDSQGTWQKDYVYLGERGERGGP